MIKSKRLVDAHKTFDRAKLYTLPEAVKLVKQSAKAKFDETIELSAKMGVDPRKADQQIRGTVQLPHGTGKQLRVVVFAEGALAEEAKQAGADYVGSDDLTQKIAGGWVDFDIALATPDMMRNVGKLGKVLGPRGLMPNPKAGTVSAKIGEAVQEFKAGKIEYRLDKQAGIHVPVGKASFAPNKLEENIRSLVSALMRAKPSTAKGQYLKGLALSSTMGIGVKLDLSDFRDA
ncbi:MAG TPA: 50S ribosomal protein L1 [bacterium]|nr:50S ribosomal protein L1 [bacterium]